MVKITICSSMFNLTGHLKIIQIISKNMGHIFCGGAFRFVIIRGTPSYLSSHFSRWGFPMRKTSEFGVPPQPKGDPRQPVDPLFSKRSRRCDSSIFTPLWGVESTPSGAVQIGVEETPLELGCFFSLKNPDENGQLGVYSGNILLR